MGTAGAQIKLLGSFEMTIDGRPLDASGWAPEAAGLVKRLALAPSMRLHRPALDQASTAALDHMGEGRVTETEVGDEESLYEVEVTLDDGSQVDVQLDADFNVVGTENDGVGEDDD